MLIRLLDRIIAYPPLNRARLVNVAAAGTLFDKAMQDLGYKAPFLLELDWCVSLSGCGPAAAAVFDAPRVPAGFFTFEAAVQAMDAVLHTWQMESSCDASLQVADLRPYIQHEFPPEEPAGRQRVIQLSDTPSNGDVVMQSTGDEDYMAFLRRFPMVSVPELGLHHWFGAPRGMPVQRVQEYQERLTNARLQTELQRSGLDRYSAQHAPVSGSYSDVQATRAAALAGRVSEDIIRRAAEVTELPRPPEPPDAPDADW